MVRLHKSWFFDFKFFIIRDLYFFYYQNIPMKYLLKRMFLIGCGLLVAFVLGILSTYVLWLEPFAVALVAFSSRFVLRLFHISKPGGLFLRCFLPWERACSCQSLNYRSSHFIFLWVSFLPWLRQWLQNYWIHGLSRQLKSNFKERFHEEPLVIIDSVFYSAALFLSVYVSHGLNLHNPYWLTLSCASILLAENLMRWSIDKSNIWLDRWVGYVCRHSCHLCRLRSCRPFFWSLFYMESHNF